MSRHEKAPTEGQSGIESPKKIVPERGESRVEGIEEAFDELLEDVQHLPEAKIEGRKIALEAVILQFRKIAEQAAKIQDMEQLQEMKRLMYQKWQELNELVGGDAEMVRKLQEWSKRFIEQKVIYYEFLENLHDDIAEKGADLSEYWQDTGGTINEIDALIAPHTGDPILSYLLDRSEAHKSGRTPMEEFLEPLIDVGRGVNIENLDFKPATDLISHLNRAIIYIEGEVRKSAYGKVSEQGPALLAKLKEQSKMLRRKIQSLASLYKTVHKVRDTSFLGLYNTNPEDLAV